MMINCLLFSFPFNLPQECNVYTEKQIGELIDTSDAAVEKAIWTLWMHQTAEEKEGRHTGVENGVGFNKFDAKSGCFFGAFIDKVRRGTNGYPPRPFGEILSQPWGTDGRTMRDGIQSPAYRIAKCRKIARKYVRQLTRLANAKLEQTATV